MASSSEVQTYDYLVQIFNTPGWLIPIQDLIDSKCLEHDEFTVSNSVSYYEEYKSMVTTMLQNIASSLNISYYELLSIVQRAIQIPFYYHSFDKVRASFDISEFVEITNTRNYELTIEAMDLMEMEERQDLTIKNIESLEKEKADIELAMKQSLYDAKEYENKEIKQELKEKNDLILALELSASEFIENELKSLEEMELLKNEIYNRVQQESIRRVNLMNSQEMQEFNKIREELEIKKKEFEVSQSENKMLFTKEKKLKKINKRLEVQLKQLEIEFQDVHSALLKEEQRLNELKKAQEEKIAQEEKKVTEGSEVRQGLNKVQLKKQQDFSIDILLKKEEINETAYEETKGKSGLTPCGINKPSKEIDEQNEKVQALRARYLKMKDMIKNRNESKPSVFSSVEKKPLPILIPLDQHSTETKKEFLQNFK